MSVFDIRDKDGQVLKKSSKEPAMPFAEEVLVTKADMEEKRGRMQELEMQVAELTLQSEYQLRLKDLNMNEKIKDLTEKFQAELDEDKSKFEMLLQEKNEQEMEYEGRSSRWRRTTRRKPARRRIDTSKRSSPKWSATSSCCARRRS